MLHLDTPTPFTTTTSSSQTSDTEQILERDVRGQNSTGCRKYGTLIRPPQQAGHPPPPRTCSIHRFNTYQYHSRHPSSYQLESLNSWDSPYTPPCTIPAAAVGRDLTSESRVFSLDDLVTHVCKQAVEQERKSYRSRRNGAPPRILIPALCSTTLAILAIVLLLNVDTVLKLFVPSVARDNGFQDSLIQRKQSVKTVSGEEDFNDIKNNFTPQFLHKEVHDVKGIDHQQHETTKLFKQETKPNYFKIFVISGNMENHKGNKMDTEQVLQDTEHPSSCEMRHINIEKFADHDANSSKEIVHQNCATVILIDTLESLESTVLKRKFQAAVQHLNCLGLTIYGKSDVVNYKQVGMDVFQELLLVEGSVETRRLFMQVGQFSHSSEGKRESKYWKEIPEMKFQFNAKPKALQLKRGDGIDDEQNGVKKFAATLIMMSCEKEKSFSNREAFLESMQGQLSKYNLTIDVYHQKSCENDNTTSAIQVVKENSLEDLVKAYKFIFILEAHLCESFQSEFTLNEMLKLSSDTHKRSIPVVFGGMNYVDILPHRSYIDALSHRVETLAHFLNEVHTNHSLYQQFFRWHEYLEYQSDYNWLQQGICETIMTDMKSIGEESNDAHSNGGEELELNSMKTIPRRCTSWPYI